MKRHKYIFGLFFLLFPYLLAAQEVLESYLQTAAENNLELKVKFNQYLAALEGVPQVKALPDPQLAFGYFISPVETRVGPQQFKISATQMFPWFGTLETKENVAIQTAKGRYELFLEAKSKLFNEVRSTYFNIYFNRRATEITRENLTILRTFQKLAQVKVEAGKGSAVDEYRIAMEIGDLENQLAQILDKQHVLEIIFNNLLNLEEEQEVITPEVLWHKDLPLSKDQVLDSIRVNNHQLLVLSFRQEALAFRKELAEKQGNPDFSIGLDYTFIGQGSNNLSGRDAFMFPMIGISIPLYRNKYRAMVNEVMYLQEANANEQSNQMNMLGTILEKAWTEYMDAGRRLLLYDAQLDLADQSLKLLETEYATSNEDFEEILRMERRMLTYSLELEKARSDKQAAISFINYLMGQES